MIHKINFGFAILYTGDRGWELFKDSFRRYLHDNFPLVEKKTTNKTHFGEFTITTPDLDADNSNKD